ncbi:MAG: hypothetical protein KTR31_36960 [Myxococcales bacterium]|nr:hypothetical protein [Myxococcales bacterium]
MSTHLSTLTLHQLRYGDLDASAMQAAREHLQSCPRCAARIEVQRRERDAFVAQPIPEALRQPAPRPSLWPALRWVGLALAAAAAVLVWVRMPAAPTQAADRVAYKGTLPQLEVWTAAPGESVHLLGDDEVLGAGDRVSFKYDARGAAHVAFAGETTRARWSSMAPCPPSRASRMHPSGWCSTMRRVCKSSSWSWPTVPSIPLM